MKSQVTANNSGHTRNKPLTAIILLPEDEFKTWLVSADHLLKLSELKRDAVFNQIESQTIEQNKCWELKKTDYLLIIQHLK